jgi:hypothetical protein
VPVFKPPENFPVVSKNKSAELQTFNPLSFINQGRAVVNAPSYNRQVSGSIPDGVIGIFQQQSSSGRTMALGSTHPLKEMRTRCISLR